MNSRPTWPCIKVWREERLGKGSSSALEPRALAITFVLPMMMLLHYFTFSCRFLIFIFGEFFFLVGAVAEE